MSAVESIILSCEHAGNRVPARYGSLFSRHAEVLTTHRGYDIGIRPVAVRLRQRLGVPLCQYTWTRLLVDVNRTHKRFLFSAFSRPLPQTDKQHLIESYYRPYREHLERLVWEQSQTSRAIHLSLHSFTPILNGQVRNADIGLLYDPSRAHELDFALHLQHRLKELTGLRIRRNYPYAGRSDGMTAWLRGRFLNKHYVGIEIEFNQALLARRRSGELAGIIAEAVQQ